MTFGRDINKPMPPETPKVARWGDLTPKMVTAVCAVVSRTGEEHIHANTYKALARREVIEYRGDGFWELTDSAYKDVYRVYRHPFISRGVPGAVMATYRKCGDIPEGEAAAERHEQAWENYRTKRDGYRQALKAYEARKESEKRGDDTYTPTTVQAEASYFACAVLNANFENVRRVEVLVQAGIVKVEYRGPTYGDLYDTVTQLAQKRVNLRADAYRVGGSGYGKNLNILEILFKGG